MDVCLSAGRLIEEPSNLELLVREDVALQQLVLASMGINPLVVQQAVKIMSAVGAYAGAAKRLVKHNVVRAITGMLASGDKVSTFDIRGACTKAHMGHLTKASQQLLMGATNIMIIAYLLATTCICLCADVCWRALCFAVSWRLSCSPRSCQACVCCPA